MNTNTLKSVLALCLSAFIASAPMTALAQEAAAETESGARVMAISVQAEIIDINSETREFTLKTAMGDQVTVTASADIERFDEFGVGDFVTTSYIASLEGEVREPTEAELAEPWVEVSGAAVAGSDIDPGAMVGRTIQAVCTIEGMNRLTQTVTVLDPRGKYHVIGEVEPEKMEGVTLGTTVVLTYSEAIAVTLEKATTATE
ncbi:MAG: hypothetical protein V7746_00320 [Halioglobus sp.]